jgi:hypothetical protein
LAAAAFAALAANHAAAAGPDFKAELALGYDSNVVNVRQGGAEREAGFALASGSVERFWKLGQQHGLLGQFKLETQVYSQYQELDSAKGALLARYYCRPGRGFYAPTFALSGSAAWWEFDSRLRDSAEYRVSAFVLEQLTTRISARLTGAGNWRRAQEAVFDLETRSLALDLDWILTSRFAAYLGYQRRWGDFVTTTPAPPASLPVVTADDAFPGEFAVRQDGAADIGTLGFNLALSPRWAIDVQNLFIEAEADNTGVHYRRLQIVASVLGRF